MEEGIEVIFVDADRGRELGRTRLERDVLLDRLASPTTFFIHGELWDVQATDPSTRAELVERDSARITVRRQEPIAAAAPVKDLPSGMSSLCGALPPMTGQPTLIRGRKPCLKLHEDAWRDVEFVADRAQAAVVADSAQAAIDRNSAR